MDGVVHDGTLSAQHVAEVNWTQTIRGGTGVAGPGAYFFIVESLVPATRGKTQTGSFVVIK